MLDGFFEAQTVGPKTNNMGPSKVQNLETGGIDYLVFQVFGSFDDFPQLSTELEFAKQSAQDGGTGEMGLGSSTIRVKPHGSGRWGNRAKWMFAIQGITFAVMDRPNSSEGHAILRVEIPSMPLMSLGLRGCIQVVRQTLRRLGCSYHRSKCIRLDLCADVVGLSMGEVYKKWLLEHVVRETRKFSIHGEGSTTNCQTLTVGSKWNPVKLRIYDKVAEVESDEAKKNVFEAFRSGGDEVCTRVEFEITRDAIRDRFKLDTVEEVLSNIERIATELTTSWFRITEEKIDRNHTERSVVWCWWSEVERCFGQWISGIKQAPAKIPEPVPASIKKKRAIVRGFWVSMMVDAGFLPSSVDEGLSWLRSQMVCRESKFKELVENKVEKRSQRLAVDAERFFMNKCIKDMPPLFRYRRTPTIENCRTT